MKVIEVAIIALIVSASQSLALVQAINDPAAEANIHAGSSTSKFSSEINPVRYNIDPNTKRGYYSIGSTYPNETTPIVDNKTAIIQPISNVTTITTQVSRIEPTLPLMNINKTISNTYNELFIIIDNKTKEGDQPKTSKKLKEEGD